MPKKVIKEREQNSFEVSKISEVSKSSRTILISNELKRLMALLEEKYAASGGNNFINNPRDPGFNINFKDENNNTILMQAVIQNPGIAEILIKGRANVFLQNKEGNTALILAVENEYFELIQVFNDPHSTYPAQPLAKIKQNINTKNNHYQSTLTIAVKKGSIETLEALLNAGGDIKIRDGEGNTLLIIAAKHGHYQMVQRLVDLGADANAVNTDHKSALIIAVEKNYTNIVYKLSSAKANINLRDKDGNTALLYAVKLKHLDLIAALVDMGADINTQNNKDNTPLMAAIISNDQKSEQCVLKTVQILLAKSPNLEKKDTDGNTALLLATERGYGDIAQILIDAGANFYVENNENKTVLEIATKYQYTNIVSMLVIKHASSERNEEIAIFNAIREEDINKIQELVSTEININTDTNISTAISIETKNSSNFTILMAASLYGHLDIVKLLIEKGVDVNAQDEGGRTALMYAVKSDHQDIVQLLINNNADLSATDAKGNTAIQHAINAENLDMVQLLINKGALVPLYCNVNNVEDMDININADIVTNNNRSMKNSLTIDVFVRLINKAIISHPNIVMTWIERGQEFDEVFLQRLKEIDKSVFLHETNFLHKTKEEYLKLLQIVTKLTKDYIDAQDDEGCTALMLAARANYTGLIKLLMSHKADLNIEDKKEYTATMHALNKGNLDAMQLLIQEGAKVPIFTEEDGDNDDYAGLEECDYMYTILDAIHTHPYIVERLVEEGQNFDEMFESHFQDDCHLTLLEAAIRTGHLELVKAILNSCKLSTTESEKCNEMDLAIAVSQGFIEIIELIVNDIVNSDPPDWRGPLSLITAIRSKIIEHIWLKDKIGEFYIEIDYETRLKIIGILISAGMNINAKSEDRADSMDGYTPLMMAVKKGHVEIVEMLLDAGADVNLEEGIETYYRKFEKDAARNTALTYAFRADKNNIEIIHILLKAGADINAPSIGDFVEKYKTILIEKGIGFGCNDYYSLIDDINNCDSLCDRTKKQLIDFFTQAEGDFNLECASIFNKLFNILPYPMTQLIELKREGVSWQGTIKDLKSNNDNINDKQQLSTDSQKLIDFYQQHHMFSYNLEEFLKSDVLDEQQAEVLKREITLTNIKILKENYQQLLDKNCMVEIETLQKLPLSASLKNLLNEVSSNYQQYQDVKTNDMMVNVINSENLNNTKISETDNDKLSVQIRIETTELLGVDNMVIDNLNNEI